MGITDCIVHGEGGRHRAASLAVMGHATGLGQSAVCLRWVSLLLDFWEGLSGFAICWGAQIKMAVELGGFP
jgi:hypothetical protein